ncbi:MAG: serine hydrolase [Spirochaetes bacterium]|nr:serine hydrolase [Spirochaetota bacterium]
MRWFRKLIPYIVTLAAAAVVIYLPDLSPERYSKYDDLFTHERQRQANTGFSVTIVKSGKLIYQRTFGTDGLKQALDKDTPMYLGPSSEVISGALLSSLALTGEIDLDKDLSYYLPRRLVLADPGFGPDAGQNVIAAPPTAEAGLTLRQLASYSTKIDQPAFRDYRAKTLGLEAGELDPGLLIQSRLEKGRIPRSRLVYRILGSVMEQAAGSSFDEILQSRILIPLGMHGTTSRPDSLQGVAVGSGLFFGLSFPYEARVPSIAAPADGIVTTAGDLGKFLACITGPTTMRSDTAGALRLSVASLHEPLLPKGDTGFGWRIPKPGNRKMVYQGGSVEGFCSRIVLWPDDKAGIAILCSQGGAIQSNIVLPLLTQAAENILFTGSTPRLPPLGRILVLLGIAILVYLLSIFFQTLTALSWAKALRDKKETGKGDFYLGAILTRTILGLIGRVAIIVATPLLVGFVVGTNLEYHDLLVIEPGATTFLLFVMLVGCMRNVVRLVWHIHISRC